MKRHSGVLGNATVVVVNLARALVKHHLRHAIQKGYQTMLRAIVHNCTTPTKMEA